MVNLSPTILIELFLFLLTQWFFWVVVKHRTPECGTAEYGTTNPEQ